MQNIAFCSVFSIVIYKGDFNSKWSKYTKFSNLRQLRNYKKFRLPGFCENPMKPK